MLVYRGQKIIPAPLADISSEKVSTRGGVGLARKHTVTLRGKIVAFKGSPNSAGQFHSGSGYPADESVAAEARLGAILAKQDALRTLFSDEHGLLELTSPDGSATKQFVVSSPRFEFSQGVWFDTCDYTITLQADDLDYSSPSVDSCTESWSMEAADENLGTYRLSHSVSATAQARYDESGALIKHGWEYAKEHVLSNVGAGLDASRMEAPGVLDASSLQAFNYVRGQQLDEQEGSFSLTESWTCFNPGGQPPAVEDYTVDVRKLNREAIANQRYSVSVRGTVTGLERRDNSTWALVTTKWANAKSKWDSHVKPSLYARATAEAGVTLNATPMTEEVGFNPNTGVVTYSYEYTDRPSSGYLSESVRVTDSNQGDVYASIPVIGRAAGPVLQSIGTKTARRRSLGVSYRTLPQTQDYTPAKPSTDALVAEKRPVGAKVFVDSDEESWDEKTGEYSRQVTWTWEA
jgi:hypothetical protein